MCQFASFVLTKDRAFWSRSGDSHETIIEEHGLRDDATRTMIVRGGKLVRKDGEP